NRAELLRLFASVTLRATPTRHRVIARRQARALLGRQIEARHKSQVAIVPQQLRTRRVVRRVAACTALVLTPQPPLRLVPNIGPRRNWLARLRQLLPAMLPRRL